MQTFKTITGDTIKISANRSKRTFTIITSVAKYRTIQMSKEEFNSSLYHTGNDWMQFLKTDNYYRVN